VLLLDTHVWIWAVEGDERRLGRRSRSLLTTSEARGAIRVSPVSVFEIVALHTLGRLRLTRTPERWIRDALDAAGVRIAELSVDVAMDAGQIPREVLADPIDRLLVASARQLDGVLMTADARILEYASSQRNVHVHDAGR
jgi:PIN domain nuclease of toxin-antitoxin system